MNQWSQRKCKGCLCPIYALYHIQQHAGRDSKVAGEQIKLLEENVVSGRIEDHVLLHRYSAIMQEISTVDIIAGERGGAENGFRLGSQRTATPTARGFLTVLSRKELRCRISRLDAGIRCRNSRNRRIYKDVSRCCERRRPRNRRNTNE